MGLRNQVMELLSLPMVEVAEVEEEVEDTVVVVEEEAAVVVVVVVKRPTPQCWNLSQVLSKRLALKLNALLFRTGSTSTYCACAFHNTHIAPL